MEVTPIGILCLAACLLIVARPFDWGLALFAAFLPLQTAAALNLPALGGASVLASHVMIGALAASLLVRPASFRNFLYSSTRTPMVGVLGAFVLYAIFSATFLPRLFEGDILVYSLDRAFAGERLPLTFLAPSTGNITQSVYLMGGFGLFAFLVYAFQRPGGLKAATTLMNIATGVFVLFAILSAFPPNAVTDAILGFVRTANYEILTEQRISSFSRIIGAAPEPSVFGGGAVVFFVYSFLRYLQSHNIVFALASLVLIFGVFASLSTTGYATLLAMIMLWSLGTVGKLLVRGLSREDMTALFISAIAGVFVVSLLFVEPVQDTAIGVVDELFGEKLVSDSGQERSAWNGQSFSNFVDTMGLGVGFGSARASSQPLALLGNTGLIGGILFAVFVYATSLKRLSVHDRADYSDLQRADIRRARALYFASSAAGLAHLVSVSLSGTLADPGLRFFAIVAVAYSARLFLIRSEMMVGQRLANVRDFGLRPAMHGSRPLGRPAE